MADEKFPIDQDAILETDPLCPNCNPERVQTMRSATSETEGVKCTSCGDFFPVYPYAILTWTSKDYKRLCEINGTPANPDEVELLRKRLSELEALVKP